MESLPTFQNSNQDDLPPSIGDTPEYILDDPNNLAAASTILEESNTENLANENELPEDGLTFLAEEEEEPILDVDHDHDHEEGDHDHEHNHEEHNHEDGTADHTHEDGEASDHSHGENGGITWDHDHEDGDHDHDHEDGDHDHDHNHEDGAADHTHADGEASDHTHGENGDIIWDHDHLDGDHGESPPVDIESKIGEMDPDKLITPVPPPTVDQDSEFEYERGWDPSMGANEFDTKDGEPAMDNMIVRPGDIESESAGTVVPTDLESLESELEDFLSEEIEEITEESGADADVEGDDEDSDEDKDADGDESADDEDGDDAADEDGDESPDEDEDDEDDEEDENITSETQVPTDLDSIEKEMEEEGFIQDSVSKWHTSTSGSAENENIGSSPEEATTQVPTDLDSIEKAMEEEGFIQEAEEKWHNVTMGNSNVEESEEDEDEDEDESSDENADEDDESDETEGNDDGGGDDAYVDESNQDENSANESPTLGPTKDTSGAEGSNNNKTPKPKGPEGKKDGIEDMLDDETKNALFGTPTLAPTAKMVWNDAAPVFKPGLSDGDTCTLSSISAEACMKNTYVLGGAASILVILLLCICRKCCCRTGRSDARGQYRQVAAQYGDMKYDNTFSDDYSTGSGGDIELSLAEVNG